MTHSHAGTQSIGYTLDANTHTHTHTLHFLLQGFVSPPVTYVCHGNAFWAVACCEWWRCFVQRGIGIKHGGISTQMSVLATLLRLVKSCQICIGAQGP